MSKDYDNSGLYFFILIFLVLAALESTRSLTSTDLTLIAVLLGSILVIGISFWFHFFSRYGRSRKERIDRIKDLPGSLKTPSPKCVRMGIEKDLGLPIFLPDNIRSRHVHILGATGSGKTESVILNFLKQDIARGLGAIVLDAKADASFLMELESITPKERLKVFDLSGESSLGYDPLKSGNTMESAQRLFSSLQWSEEYYKSKALAALQALYEYHFSIEKKNPQLIDLAHYLESPETYAMTRSESGDKKSIVAFTKEYSDILGLRDQINSLCLGYLQNLLSPNTENQIDTEEAMTGKVLYFRLQSLMSPQLVGIVGRLLINNLNYLAGTAHKRSSKAEDVKLIPVYLDEFASFACPEFADLISKARSAGLALHFSHQSIGDLTEVSKGFLNRITDNSATKIVLRINDPDSAEYMARTFGTKIYQKITQRVTNSKEADLAESIGEGSIREAHQYRAAPDLLKTLPTGTGSVLIAHGENSSTGGSCVLKVRFPALSHVERGQ